MIEITYKNQNKCNISGPELDIIRDHFSVPNDAKRFYRGSAKKFANSRVYIITPAGNIDIGLIPIILDYCTKVDIEISNIDSRILKILVPRLPDPTNKFDLKYDLREYQKDVVNRCIKNGRGIIELGTSGGKTLVIASLLEYYFQNVNKFFKCLIIVPDLGLVSQTFKEFETYNVNFTSSIWTGKDEFNPNTNVVIANLGILQSKKSDIKWISAIDVLIIDEVHSLRKQNKINSIIDNIKCPNKFGFTGTLPENKLDIWNLYSKIGSRIYRYTGDDLRKNNFASNVYIQRIEISYKTPEHKIYRKDDPRFALTEDPKVFYTQEKEFIQSSNYRNKLISELSKRLDNNGLILIDHIKHGEILFGYLNEIIADKEIYFIRGEVVVDERKRIQNLMEEQNNIIVIAISKIFSTGINIKNLHYIFFAGGGKSKIRIIQSIGRGMRLHPDKKRLIIFDICDNLRFGLRHSKNRIKIYNEENIDYGTINYKEES